MAHLPADKSPKSVPLPALAIVTYSITSELPELETTPPPVTPLVLLENAVPLYLAVVKLPKSVAFPLVENVT